MEVDARVGTSQSSSTPFPWPFTQSPSTGGTPAAPKRHDTPSVPASAPPPEVQQEDQASASHLKGVQAGAPPIPRAFCDEILKDLWFRSIWIDLHQALTIDRESSRDRAPIGLVRCICKDDYKKGQHAAHVKFKLGRGMGSPIPRLEEGAWTREGPRVVGGGF